MYTAARSQHHLLSTLVVLESNCIIHRDLKPENIQIINRCCHLRCIY